MESAQQRAIAALWSLQGVGRKTLDAVSALGPLEQWLEVETPTLVPLVKWSPQALESLSSLRCLADAADSLEAALAEHGYDAIFSGDPRYPARLEGLGDDAPPMLFVVGPGAAVSPRRRVAMVGSRRVDPGFLERAKVFVDYVSRSGVGAISGGAEGVDQACHGAALRAGGETWAFLGCALDQIDAGQRVLVTPFRDHGGTLFSEYPPGTRSSKATFPRRNRLIAAAADAVLVLRATLKSGALHTAEAGQKVGRPVLAMPGDFFNPAAEGCNALIAAGAHICLEPKQLLDAINVTAGDGLLEREAPSSRAVVAVSPLAERVLEHLHLGPVDFDVLLGMTQVGSGALASVLLELELANRVVKRPGKRYECRA